MRQISPTGKQNMPFCALKSDSFPDAVRLWLGKLRANWEIIHAFGLWDQDPNARISLQRPLKEIFFWKYITALCLACPSIFQLWISCFSALLSFYFPMRISLSPVSLKEKWYNTNTFLVEKFTGLCMDSLTTSCYIISNKTQQALISASLLILSPITPS